MLCARLLALTINIMMDVNTMTDIVKPIANTLADAVAPVHPELAVETIFVSLEIEDYSYYYLYL